jgi:hypothetical protein
MMALAVYMAAGLAQMVRPTTAGSVVSLARLAKRTTQSRVRTKEAIGRIDLPPWVNLSLTRPVDPVEG